jgi:hypothetical protein
MGTRSLSEFRQKIKMEVDAAGEEYSEQVADQLAIGTAIRQHDFAFLTDLVRDNTELSPEARDLLADGLLGLLSGQIKRAPHRPRTTTDKSTKIAERVIELEAENWPRKAAIAKVAEEFRCSSRWVSMALSKNRKAEHFAAQIAADTKATISKRCKDLGLPDEDVQIVIVGLVGDLIRKWAIEGLK